MEKNNLFVVNGCIILVDRIVYKGLPLLKRLFDNTKSIYLV